jgi:hypothetical protein
MRIERAGGTTTADLRLSGDLPFRVAFSDLVQLRPVSPADPLACQRMAIAKGEELERHHGAKSGARLIARVAIARRWLW